MAHESSESIGKALRQGECRKNQGLHAGYMEEGIMSIKPSVAYNQDASIARLRKLRDYYRQTSQPREVKAIERAIVVLREVM